MATATANPLAALTSTANLDEEEVWWDRQRPPHA